MEGGGGSIYVTRCALTFPYTLRKPLRFYGLDCFAQKIRGETCELDLLQQDRHLRVNESIARDDPTSHQKTMLIDVHTADVSPQPRTSLEQPLLLQDVPPPTLKGGFLEFWEHLNAFSGELLE